MAKKADPNYYKDCFRWICEYATENTGRMPTLRDLVRAGWFASTSTASYALEVMAKQGWLRPVEVDSVTHYVIVGATFEAPPVL